MWSGSYPRTNQEQRCHTNGKNRSLQRGARKHRANAEGSAKRETNRRENEPANENPRTEMRRKERAPQRPNDDDAQKRKRFCTYDERKERKELDKKKSSVAMRFKK